VHHSFQLPTMLVHCARASHRCGSGGPHNSPAHVRVNDTLVVAEERIDLLHAALFTAAQLCTGRMHNSNDFMLTSAERGFAQRTASLVNVANNFAIITPWHCK
jgi:hypothetical protein